MSAAAEPDLTWLETFLPLLQCPDTHQSLRWAQTSDLIRHALPQGAKALVSDDGAHFFPIEKGIPILLPLTTRSAS